MADRYWVGGTGTWNTTSTTNWSATSGGASGASVPTVSDSVFFDQASTYTVTMTGALACLDFNVTGGTVTFQNGTTPTLNVRGSWSTVAATVWNTTGAITFSATTSRTITTNAITIRSPITFSGSSIGTWTLQDNLTLLSTLTTTLSVGTLALNNFTLSTGIFTSTVSTTRVITFGTTGQITLTGNAATVLNMATLTGFTYTGTARIYSNYSGATGTRTFLLGTDTGAVPTNVFNVSFGTSGTGLVIAPATDTVSLQGVYFNVDFTNLTNTVSNDTRSLYGNLTVPASGGTFTAGSNVTNITAGIAVDINVQRTLDFPFSVNSDGGTLNFLNNFTIGSTRTFTLTRGTLALSTFTLTTGLFNSSNSNVRTINFGTGKIVLNSATTSTIWTTGTTTNLTISGTPLVECIGGGTAVTKTINTGAPSEANSISFSLLDTGGTPTYAFSASNVIRNLIVNGAQTVSNINLIIYGTFTHLTTNGTTTFTAGANAWTFAATSGSYTVTNIAGFTYDFPWTFGSATSTATWTIAANLTLGATRQLSLTNGTFDFNNKTFSGAGVTIVTGTPTIANTGGPGSLSLTVPITHTSGSLTLPFNLTTTSASGYTLTAGTLTLNNFTLTAPAFNSSSASARTLAFGTTGQLALTGNGVTIFNLGTVTNLTITGTFYVNSTYTGSVGTRTILWGSVAGSTEALAQNVSFSGTTGIVLSPSATDTIALSGGFNNIDFTGFTGTLSSTGRTIFGNLTMPASGGTFAAGTSVTTFGGTGTETITTNGRTLDFPITFSGVGGTFRLLDNLTVGSTRLVTLTNGTLDLNNFTLSAGQFNSSGSTARTLAFGTGQLALTGNNLTLFDITTATNFSTTGTVYVKLITGSVGTRTFVTGFTQAQAAAGYDVSTSGTSGIVITPSGNVLDVIALTGNYNNVDLTGFTNTLSNTARTIYGNLTMPASGGTFTAGTNATTFIPPSATTKTITSNGRTLDFPITLNGAAGSSTLQLIGNLTLGSSRDFTLTQGIIDINNNILSTGGFSSNNSNTRTLAFGSTGQLALTFSSTGTVFNLTTATNFTTTGTVYINAVTGARSGTGTYTTGFTEAQAAGYDVKTTGTTGFVINAGAAETVILSGNWNNFDLTGFTGILSNTARTLYGNLTVPASGGTFTAGSSVTTFAATSGTKTITTNGRTPDFPVTINGAGGTFQLQDNFTLGSTRAFTLTAGTLALNNLTLSAATFSSSGTGVRSVAFGTSGLISLVGNNATIVNLAIMTNFTYTGTPKIYSTYTGGTGTRTFNIGDSNAAGVTTTNIFDLSIGTSGNGLVIAAGTDAHALIGSFNIFDLTGFTGTLGNNTRFIYGSFTIPSTGGSLSAGTSVTSFVGSGSKTLSTGGRTLDFPVTIDGAGGTFQLLSNFAIGSTRAFTLTAGALNLNDFILSAATFSSNNGNTRSVAFGSTGIITLGGNGATIVDFTNMTNFTYTGTPKIYSTYTGATGTRTFNFGNAPATGATSTNVFDLSIGTSGDGLVISTGTDILAPIGSFNSFNLTGLTQTINNNSRFIYGDFTVPASGGTLTAGTNVLSFVGVSSTKNITTNGRTLDFPITFDGAATFRLQSALLQGSTRAFTHTNGTIDLNGYTLTVGTAYTTATGTKNLTFNGGSLVCPANTATAFNNAVPGGFTTTAGTGTGTISLTAATAKTFVGNNAIYNCDIDQGGAGALTITGLNTFNRIKSSYANTTANASILLPIETIVTGIVGGSASNKMLDLGPATATAAPSKASVVISNSIIQTASYVQANSIIFNASELQNPSSQTSVLFDGTGDYLTVASNAQFAYGAGNFTWECWIFPTSATWTSSNIYILDHGSNGGTLSYNGNKLLYYNGTIGIGSVLYTTGFGAVTPFQWTHIAAVRSSGTTYLYKNGVLSTSATDGHNYGNQAVTIGEYGSLGYAFTGYITNVRLVKGTAVYTSAFTPPTSALTAIANTSLLTCQSATFVDNGPNNFTVTAVGDSTVSPFSPFDNFTDGTTPWRLYLANSINRGDTLGAVFQEYSNSAPIVYYITRGTSFTVPADWDNSNNAIHIYGAGGGSSGSYVPNSSGNRLGSAGGGGGGYTQVLNLTATPGSSLSYNIGLGGAAGSANTLSSSGGAGGNTTFAGIYTANGGGGSSITSSTTTAGTGGTGATANGGVGGLGGGAADDTDNSSGGGGGGSGGPNGAGANGGTGVVANNPSNTPGGGGGGSGGGTNGTNAVTATPGTGGNSFIGVRVGGTGGLANTLGGIIGRERGRASYDILGSVGGAGGGGGGGATGPSIRDGLNIGGGAGGSGATDSDFANPGTAGESGGIIIVYYPSAVVSGNFSNMFLLF